MDTDSLIEAVIAWGKEHKLDNPIMQYAKVNEEIGEIGHELTRNHIDTYELRDAIGDSLVTIIILASILNLDPMSCLYGAYLEISKRKGVTENGTFVKEQ